MTIKLNPWNLALPALGLMIIWISTHNWCAMLGAFIAGIKLFED